MPLLNSSGRGRDRGSPAGHTYQGVHIDGSARAHLGDTYHLGDRNYGLQLGQSFAPITAEIHLPSGKLEQDPSSPMLTTAPTQIGWKHHQSPPPPSPSAATLISSIVEHCLISCTKGVLYRRQGLLWSAWAGLGT
jgi:hypothetical protein